MFSGGEWRGLCRGLALRDGRAAWQPAVLPREKTASHNPSVSVSVKSGCFFSDKNRKGAGGSGQRFPRALLGKPQVWEMGGGGEAPRWSLRGTAVPAAPRPAGGRGFQKETIFLEMFICKS